MRSLSLFWVSLVLFASAAHAASYVYDANGRLRAVTTSTGDSAEYIYDALGNIYAINTVPAGQVAVFAFTPNHGPVGQPVTISGQGFSATPSLNTVSFNGTATTVTSASTTQLLASVPAGATTGPISVQVGSNTATSIDNFIVTTDSGGLPPTIASFTPAVVNTGATVAVTGSHFIVTSGSTQAGVDAYQSTVTPSSDTQLNFTVSSKTGSGPVTVTTPYGSAQSNAPLIVAPSNIAASNVLSTTALTIDGAAQSISINQASKYVAATFQATAGQWLTLQWSNVSINPPNGYQVFTSVYDRNNNLVASGMICMQMTATPYSLHLPRLAAGTYTVFMQTGSNTAQFSLALESDKWMSVDGAGLAIPTTLPGQSKRILFNVNQGDSVGVGVSNFWTNGQGNPISAHLYKPDGTEYVSIGGVIQPAVGSPVACSPSGCDVILYHAPQGGTYGLVVDSYNGSQTISMSYTATVKHNVVTALSPNVTSSVSLAAGQIGQLTFSGTAGASMALQFAGVTSGKVPVFTVINPDGTLLATASNQAGYTFNLANLPQTGTYTAMMDPSSGAATNFQATVIPSASAAAVVDGSSISVPTTLAGQFAYFDFTANAGDNLNLGINNLVLTNSNNGYVGVYVYRPDGVQVYSYGGCTASGCTLQMSNLPQGGIYGVIVKPQSGDTAAKMSFTGTVSHDYTTALTANTTSTASLRSGQYGRFTFSGTAGTTVALQVAGISTTPSGKTVTLTVFKPDGTTLTSASTSTATTFYLTNLLSVNYTLLTQTANGAATNLQVTLIPSATGTAIVDGASYSQPTTTAGQYASFDFTVNASSNIDLGINNLVLTNSTKGYVSVSVYNPDGTLLGSKGSCSPGGCDINLPYATQIGVYGVIVAPVSDPTAKMSFTGTVSNDAGAVLSSGVDYSLNLSRYGQNAWLRFPGTAGGSATIQIASIASAQPINFIVYNSANWAQVATGQSSTSYTFHLTNLPTTGNYYLYVDPSNGATATMTVTLNPNASGAATIDGASYAQPTTLAGQSAYFSFTSNAASNLGFGISNLVLTNSAKGYVSVSVYNPDGTLLGSKGSCSPGGCDVYLPWATQIGVYGVFVAPVSDPTAKMSFTGTVSNDATTVLSSGVGYNLNLSRYGQNAWLQFPGTAGGSRTVQITNISSAQPVKFIVYNSANWAAVATGQSSTSYTFNLTNLPTTGSYYVYVDPSNGATATMTVTFN